MGWYYEFYSPKTGKKIDAGKYNGMPFFYTKFDHFDHNCVLKWDKNFENIEKWSVDGNSNFYKQYYSGCSYGLNLYYTKSEILEMQKSMTCNEHLLEELMENNNLDGLIVVINWSLNPSFKGFERRWKIIKQNSFTISLLLDEDKIDKETVMYHIYHAIQRELNNDNVNYMNLLVTPSKSYGDLLKEDKH